MQLKDDWRAIVRKAWSIKFMLLAFVFTSLEVMLPFFNEDIPRATFAVLSGLSVAGAFVTRLLAQKDVE